MKKRFPIWLYILIAFLGALLGAGISFGDSVLFIQYPFLNIWTVPVIFSVLFSTVTLFADRGKMPQTIVSILIIISAVIGLVYLDSTPSDYSGVFREEISRAGVERVGQPIEGFNAFIYLESFPGFKESDFDGVETFEGIYKLEGDELKYERTSGNPVTSAEETLAEQGYKTLLKNLSKRLEVTVSTEADIATLLEKLRESDNVLVTNFEECIAAGNPAMESYPRQCRNGDETFVEIVAKKFISDEFGFSFEYPSRLGEASAIIFEPGKRPGGETGEKLAGSFSDFSGLEFGGISADFSAGREGLITDTRGFNQEDGKYYFKFVSNTSDMEIQPYKVIKKDFGEILLLNDQSFEGERNGTDGPVFGVGSGRLAGLVNLNRKQFSGIVFYNWNLDEFSKAEFEALLNSLELAASSETISMSQEEALEIVGSMSECTMVGIPANTATYNDVSKTWWVDLERMPELENDGCNPACVVREENKTAEVNWRCTGLIPDDKQ